MTVQEVFDRIAKATDDYPEPIDEAFVRGLAGRTLGMSGRDPQASDDRIVEWWKFATWQYTDVHPEVPQPTDAQIIGGQLFADRMGGG